jgi:hypothetical protein
MFADVGFPDELAEAIAKVQPLRDSNIRERQYSAREHLKRGWFAKKWESPSKR